MALEFAKAWYPNLDLTQLATFRLEATDKLVEAGPDLTRCAGALADYTNTVVFVPGLDVDGNVATPSWFGLDPTREDLAEQITSSDEGDDDGEFEEDEDDAPEDGAGGQPQHDQASASEPRVATRTTTDADQAETNQPAAPPSGAATSADPSNPPAFVHR